MKKILFLLSVVLITCNSHGQHKTYIDDDTLSNGPLATKTQYKHYSDSLKGLSSALSYADVNLNNLVDSSGMGRDLTLGTFTAPSTSANAFVTGKSGMVFNGSSNFVAQGSYFAMTTDFTYEWRFKRNTANNGTTQILFGRWGLSSGSQTQSYLCYFTPDNKLTFLALNGSALQTGTITDGSSHTAAVVRSGASIYMYLDGTKVATIASVADATITSDIPFRFGDYDDGASPLYATIGDFRFSNNARYTGATYTVSSTYLTYDANTLALIPMTRVQGSWLGTPVFQSNILLRTGYSQASGGWANPDGFFKTLNNKYAYSVSAYDGTKWTAWSAVADSLTGAYTVQSNAFQIPTLQENDLAANGTLIPFLGQYFHYYQIDPTAGSISIRCSVGDSLNTTYNQGVTIFQGGVGGYLHYADPFVRFVNSLQLEMFFIGIDGSSIRWLLRSTSYDGITWTTPTSLGKIGLPSYNYSPGEPAVVKGRFNSHYWITVDGAVNSSSARRIMRWAYKGGTLLPLGTFFTASGTGGYISAFDNSPYYDAPNNRFIYLATHATNTQFAQPTDSEIGMWYVPLNKGQ